MKADLISLDAARAEREQHAARAIGSAVAGLAGRAKAALVGASLAMLALGIVAAALWLVWIVA